MLQYAVGLKQPRASSPKGKLASLASRLLGASLCTCRKQHPPQTVHATAVNTLMSRVLLSSFA